MYVDNHYIINEWINANMCMNGRVENLNGWHRPGAQKRLMSRRDKKVIHFNF